MKMKIGINYNKTINAIMTPIVGLIIMFIIGSFLKGKVVLAIVLLSIAMGIIIFIAIRNIKNVLNYILIDEEEITLFRRNKPVIRIKLADIKSLVLCQQTLQRRGQYHPDQFSNSNLFILINAGTFLKKSWTIRKLRNKMLVNSEKWIAIEFSSNRYAAFKHLLPNCEIETCTIRGSIIRIGD